VGLVYKTQEYQRFGNGWVKRKADSENDWQECQLDDVPALVLEAAEAVAERQANPAAIPPAAPPKITRAG